MNATPTAHRRRQQGPREGSTLVMTVLFIGCIGMVTGSLLHATVGHRRLSHRAYERERAFNIAEAGFESVCQTIASSGLLMPSTFSTNGAFAGGVFGATATRIAPYRYAVSSTGLVNTARWTVQARQVEAPSWAKYALWMEQNGRIYFIGGETFYGHVHSNSRVYFSQVGGDGADFYDRMTSTDTSFGGTTNGATFAYGLELGSTQDSMTSVDFTELNTVAQNYGLVLTGNTFVTFNGGNMKVTNQRSGWTNKVVSVGSNDILYVKNASSGTSSNAAGRVYVSGQINGRETLVAEEDIYITDHLAYTGDPRNQPNVTDAIGLVAKDDVWVAPSAPNDLRIDAAIMAVGQVSGDDGSFGVINYDAGAPRGNLDVYGSIVQEVRGAVGTFNSSGMATGYRKNYGYDERFQTDAPPYYPRLHTKLSVAGWREGSG